MYTVMGANDLSEPNSLSTSLVISVSITCPPADVAVFLLLLKLDRWTNLRSKDAKPENEGVVDTVYDFHNYIDLGYACDIEQEDR